MDKRTRARELTIQCLYQLDVQGEDLFEFLSRFLAENEPDDSIRRLALTWAKDAWKNLEKCDEFISAASIKWSLSRLSPVDTPGGKTGRNRR